jgi:hypothetical protein
MRKTRPKRRLSGILNLKELAMTVIVTCQIDQCRVAFLSCAIDLGEDLHGSRQWI